MTGPNGTDELSRLLRTLRSEADITGAEIARRTGWSESKVNRFLHGRIVPKPDDVRRMLDVLGLADDERGLHAVELAELHPAGHASRKHILRAGTIVAQRRYAEIDRSSAHVQTFANQIVPGLLQSRQYMRVVFGSEPGSDGEIDNLVEARVERQALLHETADRRYTQLVTEGALRWQIGGPAVMAEQCEHIAMLARTAPETVRVGIIPWWQVVDVFPMVAINLYDELAVIINTGSGVTHITDVREVADFVSEFRKLCDLAVWGEAAAVEFDRVALDYRDLAASPPS